MSVLPGKAGYRSVYLFLLAEVKLGVEAEDAMAQSHYAQGRELGSQGSKLSLLPDSC